MDADGDVDADEHAFFVAILMNLESNADYVSRSALNGDGLANGQDIPHFTEAILLP